MVCVNQEHPSKIKTPEDSISYRVSVAPMTKRFCSLQKDNKSNHFVTFAVKPLFSLLFSLNFNLQKLI